MDVLYFCTVDIAEEIRSRVADGTNINVETPNDVRFGMWVSFMEIYNELIHDLLDLTPFGKGKIRPSLKLGDDKNGNPYVRGMCFMLLYICNEHFRICWT